MSRFCHGSTYTINGCAAATLRLPRSVWTRRNAHTLYYFLISTVPPPNSLIAAISEVAGSDFYLQSFNLPREPCSFPPARRTGSGSRHHCRLVQLAWRAANAPLKLKLSLIPLSLNRCDPSPQGELRWSLDRCRPSDALTAGIVSCLSLPLSECDTFVVFKDSGLKR